MRTTRLLTLAATFLSTLDAADLDFQESFADPATREAALATLVPATRDWFFHHALHQQHLGREREFQATIDAWRAASERAESPVSDEGLATLENRAALLRYRNDPKATLADLTEIFGLSHDASPPESSESEQLPSKVEAAWISADAFERDATRRTGGHSYREQQPHYMLERLPALGRAADLPAGTRRWLLEQLPHPHAEGVLPLIATELDAPGGSPFGKIKLCGQLTAGELEALFKLHPDLAGDESFVMRLLATSRPGSEVNLDADPAALAAHLSRCRAVTAKSPPALRSLQAHVLYHHLRLQRDLGQYPKEDFLTYLALPFASHPLRKAPSQTERDHAVNAKAKFSAATCCPPIGDDTPLVEDFLHHFLSRTDDPSAFAALVPDAVLRRHHARARLLAGADPAKWGTALDPAEFKDLQEETRVGFAPGQPVLLDSAAPVRIALDLKHAPELLVRIHELDLPNLLARGGGQPSVALSLDGLLPHAEKRLTFPQAPLVLHRETIDLPELAGRGVWIVEFISRGVASRTLVRKGRLLTRETRAADGSHLIHVFDEHANPIPDATATVGQVVLKPDARGRMIVPAALAGAHRTALVRAPGRDPSAPGLAEIQNLSKPTDDYQLQARFHLDREQLLAGQDAEIRVEARLTNRGLPLPAERLENATLVLAADLPDGVTTERVLGSNISIARPLPISFRVPENALTLSFRLSGTLVAESDHQPRPLTATHKLQINGILGTEQIAAALFTATWDGYRLELRGRNGEPLPQHALTLSFRHRNFTQPLRFRCRTNNQARIELGPLADIESVEASAPWLKNTVLDVANALCRPEVSLPSHLAVAAGTTLRLPLPDPAAKLHPARFQLLERSHDGDGPLRNHFDRLTLADGELSIRDLPPGSFVLRLPPGREIAIEACASKEHDGLLVSPERVMPAENPGLPRILGTGPDGDRFLVRLANPAPGTRVTLLGTRYLPEWSLWHGYTLPPVPAAPLQRFGFTGCAYLTGRTLDDEARYILDRRAAKVYPGSLLPRPGLLLHRRTDQSIEQDVHTGDEGKEGGGGFGSIPACMTKRPGPPLPPTTAAAHASLDFLARPAVVVHDLTPDARGTVSVPVAQFSACQLVSVIVTDSGHFHRVTVPLADSDPPLRDRRLSRALDPAKHHLSTRRTAVLAAGAEVVIDNSLEAEWRAFTTLGDVHGFLLGTTSQPALADFSFLAGWPSLPEERKLELFNRHACHELHLFLARRDPVFFAKHVKPALASKREPEFPDIYLLGGDLRPFLRPFAWKRLNAAEQALLARALPEARARILAELRDQWQQEAPPPEAESQLFTQTIRGNDLAQRESPMFSWARQNAWNPKEAAGAHLLGKLDSIILPVIDFEDISLEEAIDFLRQRCTELDSTETDPARKGMNFVIRKPASIPDGKAANLLGGAMDPGVLRIPELRLRNVPASQVLKYITDATNTRFRVDEYAVRIEPVTDAGDELHSRTFRVPPDFVDSLQGAPAGADADPFAEPARGSAAMKPRLPIGDLLKEKGIPFPEGASATMIGGNLIVRNTPGNLDLIEQITASMACSAPDSRPVAFGRGSIFGGHSAGSGILPPVSEDAADPFAEAEPPELPHSIPLKRSGTGRLPQPQQTRVWRESNYYQTTACEIALNRFWIDLAAWDGKGPFLSPHFNSCTDSANAALMCLAVLDLPFTAPAPEVEVQPGSLRLKAKQPLVLFYKDIRESKKLAQDSPVLVRQSFFRSDDRFRESEGNRIENAIDGPFLTGVPYGMSLIVSNPAGSSRRIDLLAQIPAGAIPLAGHPATLALTREIEPHGVLHAEAAFYFPAPGEFTVYPLHVSEGETILAHVAARKLVASSKETPDPRSWPAIAAGGTPAEVLARLRTANLHTLAIDLILWRLRDRAFFLDVARLLRERIHHVPAVSAYGFLHDDPDSIRDFLEASQAVEQVGAWFDSPLLRVRPDVHLFHKTLEFDPLVNPRAHQFGKHPRFSHEQALEQWRGFLDQLAWKPALDDDDRLVLTWFLLLQDRHEEAVRRFAEIRHDKPPQPLIHDYLQCVVLFLQEQPEAARRIATIYQNHPLALWRERFRAVIAQADAVAAADKPQPATPPAAAPASLDLALTPEGKLLLTHRSLDQATLRLHGVDLEVLFSANPFLDQRDAFQPAVRPNHTMTVKLDADGVTEVELPPGYRRGSVLVGAEAGSLRLLRALDSRELELRRKPGDALLQVTRRADGRPLSKAYVKVYAEKKDGGTVFHKDGYTDLRGMFDVASHTAVEPGTIKRFAVFVSHPDHGSRAEIVTDVRN